MKFIRVEQINLAVLGWEFNFWCFPVAASGVWELVQSKNDSQFTVDERGQAKLPRVAYTPGHGESTVQQKPPSPVLQANSATSYGISALLNLSSSSVLRRAYVTPELWCEINKERNKYIPFVLFVFCRISNYIYVYLRSICM